MSLLLTWYPSCSKDVSLHLALSPLMELCPYSMTVCLPGTNLICFFLYSVLCFNSATFTPTLESSLGFQPLSRNSCMLAKQQQSPPLRDQEPEQELPPVQFQGSPTGLCTCGLCRACCAYGAPGHGHWAEAHRHVWPSQSSFWLGFLPEILCKCL